MTLLNLGNVGGLLALLAATLASACSNNPGPPPEAAVVAEIQPGMMAGVNDVPACGTGDYSWQVAANGLTNGMPSVYANGTNEQGGPLQVSCKVDQNGNSFSIQLAAILQSGMATGSLFVTGTVQSSGTSTGLSATFTMDELTFQANNNCTFSLTYMGNPLPAGGQPAQGRIWGDLDCQMAVDTSASETGADGGAIARTCEAKASFLFENCD